MRCKKYKEKLIEEKGFFFFQTVLLFAIVLALGIAVFELARVERKISQNQEKATEAFYVAEAGIQMAIHQLDNNPLWSSGYKNLLFGTGKIHAVEISHSTNEVRIESQGEVGGVSRRIRVDFLKEKLPFKHVLLTNSLQLSPGTALYAKGKIMHSGNLVLPSFSFLEGQIEVDGTVKMNDFHFRGSLGSYRQIEIDEKTIIEGSLVSKEEILCNNSAIDGPGFFPLTPMIRPPGLPIVDFNWYRNKRPVLLEEINYLIEDFGAGIYMSSGDLTITAEDFTGIYFGKKAIVSEGSVYIRGDFAPQNYKDDALLIIGKHIIVDSQVSSFWGALIAKESIFIENGLMDKNFFGTLQAPLVNLPSGTINLQFYPIPGENLVRSPQTVFKQIDWLEIMVI